MPTTHSRLPAILPADRNARSGANGSGGTDASFMVDPLPFRWAVADMQVEAVAPENVVEHREAWLGLVDRCLEPNVFLDPDFCLPALRHGLVKGKPIIVLVWATGPDDRRLVGVAPLVGPRFPDRPFVSSWAHPLTAQSGPLLDRDGAVPALEALLAWMARRYRRGAGWRISLLPAAGPTARALAEVTRETGRDMRALGWHHRAVLGTNDRAGLAAVSAKKAKKLLRQRRGLAKGGDLRSETASHGGDLAEAVERFLVLEASGWKGRRGTALLSRPAEAGFVRTMTRLLGEHGRCRVDSLMVDDGPVAMGILLRAAGRDYFWKVAYDEAQASRSPGVQLVLDLTVRQHADPAVSLTDSCAQPDHPMIDHLWPGRLAVADLVIAAAPGRRVRFVALVGVERLRLGGRAMIKRFWARLRSARTRRR